MKKIYKVLFVTVMFCWFPLTTQALSVYIPQPREDEVQIDKNEYVQLHLAALGYNNQPQALARFLRGQQIVLKNKASHQPDNPRQIYVELEEIEQPLKQAYYWFGDLQFKRMFTSSGFLWLQEDVYRAQCLLNELGYQAGKPDGIRNAAYLEALNNFCQQRQLEQTHFTAILEILEAEAEQSSKKLPTATLRFIPLRSGPLKIPETHPIVKKDYAAALYLSAQGYPIMLKSQGKSMEDKSQDMGIQPVNLTAVLKTFQADHPALSQTGGVLDDQALTELANEFRQNLTRECK